MKKLIPAICMFLIAASLLGTSTFAWFSMNGSVTATGMSVTAEAPESLFISTVSGTDGFGSSAVFTSDTAVADKIAPCTPNAVWKFVSLTDKAKETVDPDGKLTGGALTAMTAFVAGTDETVPENEYYVPTEVDYFTETFWLKLDGETGSRKVSVSASYPADVTADSIKTAMHVVFADAEGQRILDYDMSSAGTAAELCTVTANAAATQITAYYFLDGADAECKTGNITADDALALTLTFTLSDN